jgi:hypothetical protein
MDKIKELIKLQNIWELRNFTPENYTAYTSENFFIYIPQKTPVIPVLITAHFDTVYEKGKFYFDPMKKVFFGSCKGDDRAGLYICYELMKQFNLYCVIFNYEELGGLGSKLFCEKYDKIVEAVKYNFMSEIKFILAFDRANDNDCVFYSCDNLNFQKYIESFGFKKAIGSFSDLSIIMPHFQKCGANLSCGFYNNHTKYEMIKMNVVQNTIIRATNIIKSVDTNTNFEYIEKPVSKYYTFYDWDDYYYDNYNYRCFNCGQLSYKLRNLDGLLVCNSCYSKLKKEVKS